jgi:hypothetical protein
MAVRSKKATPAPKKATPAPKKATARAKKVAAPIQPEAQPQGMQGMELNVHEFSDEFVFHEFSDEFVFCMIWNGERWYQGVITLADITLLGEGTHRGTSLVLLKGLAYWTQIMVPFTEFRTILMPVGRLR